MHVWSGWINHNYDRSGIMAIPCTRLLVSNFLFRFSARPKQTDCSAAGTYFSFTTFALKSKYCNILYDVICSYQPLSLIVQRAVWVELNWVDFQFKLLYIAIFVGVFFLNTQDAWNTKIYSWIQLFSDNMTVIQWRLKYHGPHETLIRPCMHVHVCKFIRPCHMHTIAYERNVWKLMK
jgi:hypothetical protein